MIKYIESHDFHYDPKWRDISLSCAESVKKAARESKADFIATSDFFNRPLIATEQGGINDVRTIIKAWTKECPVVAVEGTPRHDGHGCYNFLEDCGLTLLKPNIVYGYSQSFKNIVTMDKNHVVDCILFGIPELSKQYILSQLSLSSENANAEVEKLLEQYILEYIAPMRMKHSNIPAIGLLHGNVSDSSRENTKDIILRSSDILIRTEILEPANLTRWSLGHIHIPAEMKKICAGYAGFAGVDDNPWGKTKFVPAMNLVEIKSEDVETDDTEFGKGGIYHSAKITRIPYGTPRREKIYQMLNTYYPDIAYWLHSKDRSFTLTGGHPWSRITYEPEQKTTQRAIVNTDNLTDLFKAIDPKVSQSALAKIELLQREHSVPHLSVNVSVDFVTVKGSSFWHGKSITLKISELPTGLTAIMGDNGQGKSSLLAFCSPYPVVIGKDTKSGRQSAIHNFFIESDSSIEKHLTVNGEQHRHLINIKGAHTQTQKVECYLYINSTNQLETTSWDEMLSKCESLYGSFADYLLTTFYVQPLQGKSGSSLMSAGMTDIRNLVQSIAGVDRETEKRYALDQMAAYEKSLSDTESWIKGAEEFIIDPTELENRKSVIDSELVQKEAAILLTVEKGKTARAERDAILIKKNASDAEAKQKRTDDARAVKICDDTFVLQEEVSELKELTRQLPDMRANIKKIEEREKIESDNAKLKNEYDAKINAYNKELGELQLKVKRENADKKAKYEQEVIAYKKEKARLENAIAECESIIKRNNKPCFKCGAIPPDAENAIIEATKELQSNKEKLSVLDGPTEPKSSDVPGAQCQRLPLCGHTELW